MTDTVEKYILEFSNESVSAVDQVLSSAAFTNSEFDIILRKGNVAVVSSKYSAINEMAFLNYGTRVLKEFEGIGELSGMELPRGSFHVRKKDYTDSDPITEADIGQVLKGDREVSFSNPDFVVRAVKADHWYAGILVFKKDTRGMNQRRAPLRPFFSPVTIHPKYARFLVNISMTRPGDLILDPFCGTGGIVLEAHLMGRRALGSDASLNMVKGARLNMKYYSISAEIEHRDFLQVDPVEKVDAVITDLPYGKNSELSNYDIDELYSRVFPKFHSLLSDSGHLAIVISDPDMLEYSRGYFEEISSTPFRQHRSLTRYFVSLAKRKR